MTGLALIAEAAQAGVTLWEDNGAIRYRPKAALPPDLAAKLAANREGVLRVLAETIPATADEIRLWLSLLRDAGCRVEFKDGEPAIDWAAGLATPGRRRDWQANLRVIVVVLREEASQRPAAARRRSRPRLSKTPPAEICADPVVLCPRCNSRRVLSELREMTSGLCYGCWEEGRP